MNYLLSTLFSNTLIDMANTFSPLPQPTAVNALTVLINDMLATGTTVQQSVPAIGAQTAGTPAPTGNPIIVTSVIAGNGVKQQYMFAETLKFVISADAQTGGATQYQETCQISGAAAAWSPLTLPTTGPAEQWHQQHNGAVDRCQPEQRGWQPHAERRLRDVEQRHLGSDSRQLDRGHERSENVSRSPPLRIGAASRWSSRARRG